MTLVRRDVLTLAGLCIALAGPAVLAQQARALVRIGVLGNSHAYLRTAEWKAFVAELARRGYVEGRDLAFVHRFAGTYMEPEATARMEAQAQALLADRVDLIYAVDDGSSAWVAVRATTTVPIVFDRSWRDPVSIGLVHSLGRPSGNATGNAVLGLDLESKAFEVLVAALGAIKSIAVLHTRALMGWPSFARVADQRRTRARELGVELVFFEVNTPDELPEVLRQVRAAGIRAVKFDDPEGFDQRRREVVRHFERAQLIGLSTEADYARQGLVFGFGWDVVDIARRSAGYVARILGGARPEDLPVEQVDRVRLVINRRAAQALGLRLPPTVLARADEVIE